VPGTGEVARFPAETLGTHKDGNTEHNVGPVIVTQCVVPLKATSHSESIPVLFVIVLIWVGTITVYDRLQVVQVQAMIEPWKKALWWLSWWLFVMAA
jgi:hypothetical protein